jgi:ATP-dependent helicase/nuclease subunit A
MSDKLTKSQERALAARGVSVALSASAGCGKTTVLTRRFLGHLDGEEALGLGQIAAVTFTEKAARELRGRVRAECREQIARGSNPKLWRAVLRGLESAAIQTFHGFCGEILRKFPLEAGVEPEFEILEEAIGPTFRQDVVDECLRDWLAQKNEDLLEFAAETDLEPLRDALTASLTGMHRDSVRDWTKQSPERVLDLWQEAWARELKPRLLAELLERAQPMLRLFEQHSCSHPKMQERIAFLRAEVPRLTKANGTRAQLEAIRENARVQYAGTAKNWPREEIYEQVRDGLEAFRDAIDAVSKILDYDPEATALAAELGCRFAALATDANDAYSAAKRAAGVLDFDDLILKTLHLLRTGPEEARAAIRASCRALMVDEFQDTDSAQGEILKAIADAELATGGLFLVGDFKQSIYRFRGAEPKVFDDFRQMFPAPGRLSLNENFRSVPGIINFANALFGDTFAGPDHELRYGGPRKFDDERAAVEFVWARDLDETAGRPSVSERRKAEARWLARILARRLGEGWTLINPRTGEQQQAHAGHVVFLLRTLNDAAAYEQALAAEGLDYHVVGGTAFYAQQEVLDLINVLSVIEDPFDELALAGTLRSPFGCVSDDGLYRLCAADGGMVGGFSQSQTLAGLSDQDRVRAVRLQTLLDAWRSDKDAIPIARLVERVLTDSGHEAALAAEFLGDRKRANTRKLVRLARRFDAQGTFTLADFVARLRADFRKPPREDQAATADESAHAVRLMTIHQAKGLEFPIVVVPDLNRDVRNGRYRIAFHAQLGPIFRLEQPVELLPEADGSETDKAESSGRVLGASLYDDFERRADREEALRLFYVAVTRAQNHLILSSSTRPDERPISPALQLLAERFDLPTGRFVADLPAGQSPPLVEVLVDPPAAYVPHARRGPTDLLEVARVIETAKPTKEVGTAPPALIPARRIDLSPSRGLSPLAERVDSLVRAVLSQLLAPGDRQPAPKSARGPEPQSKSSRSGVAAIASAISIDRGIERAVGVLGLMALPAVPAEVRLRLQSLFESGLGRLIESSAETRTNLGWSLAWPRTEGWESVFGGATDLACRGPDGSWHLINLADASVPRAQERLRLLLSGWVASRFGLDLVAEGIAVVMGSDEPPIVATSFTEAEVDAAIAECETIGPAASSVGERGA